MSKKRILVCLTGASGAIYGVRLIRMLKEQGHEIHLIISKWGEETLKYETNLTTESLRGEVDEAYDENDLYAGPASGSYRLDAIVVIPCSMKTMAGIAHGYADNLIARAADCALKERRTLILVPRETPLNLVHIRNMAAVTEAGAVVFPASPAFWHKPETVEELIDSVVDRVLTHIGATEKPSIEWTGSR
ncbi:MAG: UbiX family flavin prenyltransferase [Candidatus Thorarchaeota archaeon SMTZ1-83]|nr:MAG: aromatic acid decarboxylase [Candidatus Thorarchaeota archaeon SMTZ1-83]